jgi:hypothetical protein
MGNNQNLVIVGTGTALVFFSNLLGSLLVIEPIIPVPLSIQLLGRYSGSIRSFWFIPLNTSGAAAY